ncbi:MAG: 2-succinyl-6-hydroxy-2,4-cyclohexadiene-1-carboxylate synthase [Bacteroidota bacterium]|nr:2-succinyl-6-hydroxy-2,4-cyclohexadiene-1-carboxylate synthase [Bacteroidota bacterium]
MVVRTAKFDVCMHSWRGVEDSGHVSAPVILLHGFLGTGHDWNYMMQGVRAQDLLSVCYYSIAPDIPGHGKTLTRLHHTSVASTQQWYSMESVAETIVECLDALKIQRVWVCGYSMGGRIALYLALRFPERCCGAVIASGTAGLRTDNERHARCQHDAMLAQRLETESLEEFLRMWYNQQLFDTFRQHSAFAHVIQRRVESRPHELALVLRALGTGAQPNLWDELSSARVPITFVAGEKDAKFVALARELHSMTPHSHLAILPSVGHVLHYEAADALASVLVGMIRRAA